MSSRRVRQRYAAADLQVIMVTAKDESDDIVAALQLGANDYVTKPLDFPVVLARTETQLALKRAMQDIQRLAAQLGLRNRFIRETFGRYLTDEVVTSLLDSPEGLQLGGEKRLGHHVDLRFTRLHVPLGAARAGTGHGHAQSLSGYHGRDHHAVPGHD